MKNNRQKDIPVYLFLGFLEAGKTQFIQGALEGDEFNDGKRTLLLLCEEGIEEYDHDKFASQNVFIERIGSKEELIFENLYMLTKKHRAEQIVIEYNGMWMFDDLSREMPEDWLVYQILMVADATTLLSYNKNMRTLCFDKFKACEMVIFNRFEEDMDKAEYHKLVRVANRSAQIIYEYDDEKYEIDDIEDPLPYDIDADVIKIRDVDYAIWYRDINEEADKYIGKIIEVKGRALTGGGLPNDAFVFGRHVMACCEEDIEFAGLVGKCKNAEQTIEHASWVIVRVKVSVDFHETYGESGPVLNAIEINKAAPPVEEVATFF